MGCVRSKNRAVLLTASTAEETESSGEKERVEVRSGARDERVTYNVLQERRGVRYTLEESSVEKSVLQQRRGMRNDSVDESGVTFNVLHASLAANITPRTQPYNSPLSPVEVRHESSASHHGTNPNLTEDESPVSLSSCTSLGRHSGTLSPLNMLAKSIKNSFNLSPNKPPPISLSEILSCEALYCVIVQFVGHRHVLAEVCTKFYGHIISLECEQNTFFSDVTDVEYIQCKTFTCTESDEVDDDDVDAIDDIILCSGHSSVLLDDLYWSRSSSSLGSAATESVNVQSSWLCSPFQDYESVLSSKRLFADDVPIDTTSAIASGLIFPSDLVQYHHEHPFQKKLFLPRFKYPGTVASVSCFTQLEHLTIGCIGLQADFTVTDYDMAVVIDTIGPQLVTVHLVKLNQLSSITLAMITAKCVQLRSLVVFGCEGMRVKDRNSTNIHRAFDAFGQGKASPRVFSPLNAGAKSTASQQISDVDSKRSLELLDLRYSLDLNDTLLKEILLEFAHITIFMGSNTASSLSWQFDTVECVELEISDKMWKRFLSQYCSCSKLIYIDDYSRENNLCEFHDAEFVHNPSLLFVPDQNSAKGDGMITDDCKEKLSTQPPLRSYDIAAVLETIPTCLSSQLFICPGSE